MVDLKKISDTIINDIKKAITLRKEYENELEQSNSLFYNLLHKV